MAATDQHYRKQRTLDIVFGVSCLALLGSTIWMFAADYFRGYKRVQTIFRDVEAGLAERDMVDRMPDPKLLVQRREELEEARRQLAAEVNALSDEDRKLKAERERADQVYRDIKAIYDSKSSY